MRLHCQGTATERAGQTEGTPWRTDAGSRTPAMAKADQGELGGSCLSWDLHAHGLALTSVQGSAPREPPCTDTSHIGEKCH